VAEGARVYCHGSVPGKKVFTVSVTLEKCAFFVIANGTVIMPVNTK